jgi:hypothetical protein
MMQKLRETMERTIIIVLICALVLGFTSGLYLGHKAYGLQLDTATKAFNYCRESYNNKLAFNAEDPFNDKFFDQFCNQKYNNTLKCKQINITIGDLK